MIASLRGRERIMAVQRDGRPSSTASFRARSRLDGAAECAALAFVVPRRWGTAPERNRVRRRLRHAAREADRRVVLATGDHLIRPSRRALELEFEHLVQDVISALSSAAEASS